MICMLGLLAADREAHSKPPSEVYGRKKGSVSDAVLADLAMTSVYADTLAFQFYSFSWIASRGNRLATGS